MWIMQWHPLQTSLSASSLLWLRLYAPWSAEHANTHPSGVVHCHYACVSKLSLLCRFLPLILRPQLIIHGVLASCILFNLCWSCETDSEIIDRIFPLAHASRLPSGAMRVQGHPCACFRISLLMLHSLTRTKLMRLMRLGEFITRKLTHKLLQLVSIVQTEPRDASMEEKNCMLSFNPLSSLAHISTWQIWSLNLSGLFTLCLGSLLITTGIRKKPLAV
jgi:hypothetical protein